jgi:hypothetical protein
LRIGENQPAVQALPNPDSNAGEPTRIAALAPVQPHAQSFETAGIGFAHVTRFN